MARAGTFTPRAGLPARVRSAARAGATKATRHVLARSVTRAPIEDDDLIDSATTSQTDTPQGVRGAVSYGGVAGDVPFYATIQHEDLTLRHDSGRTAKYLEGPLVEEKAEVVRIIARELRDKLR